MDKRLQTLQEKYFLPENLRKKTIKVKCPLCQGSGSLETYPRTECSLCGGNGYITEEENAK